MFDFCQFTWKEIWKNQRFPVISGWTSSGFSSLNLHSGTSPWRSARCFILKAETGNDAHALRFTARGRAVCVAFQCVCVRARCNRCADFLCSVFAVAAFWRSKMSISKESGCCPDGYRALNTSELRELLQNDDKMDQIIRLNEKVGDILCSPKCPEECWLSWRSVNSPLLFSHSCVFLHCWEWTFGWVSPSSRVSRANTNPLYMAHRLSAWRVVAFTITLTETPSHCRHLLAIETAKKHIFFCFSHNIFSLSAVLLLCGVGASICVFMWFWFHE